MREERSFLSSAVEAARGVKKKLTQKNALFGKDPWIVDYENKYLLVQSRNEREITLRVAEDVENLGSKRDRVYTIWTPPAGFTHTHEVWAPELLKFEDTPWEEKWYLSFSASLGPGYTHATFMAPSEGNDPRGPYGPPVQLRDENPAHDLWGIDLTVIAHDSDKPHELHAVWSGWDGAHDGFPQNLYIAKMTDPLTIVGERSCIAQPEHIWEGSINEAPEALYDKTGNEFLGLHYAFNESWTNGYGVGALRFQGGDPMERRNWGKLETPLYVGGGHATIGLKTRDGRSVWARSEKARKDAADVGFDDRVISVGENGWNELTKLPILGAGPVDIVSFPNVQRQESGMSSSRVA